MLQTGDALPVRLYIGLNKIINPIITIVIMRMQIMIMTNHRTSS